MKAKLDNMIAIPLSKLKADLPVPFPLYLLLKLNDRIVPVRMPGDPLGEATYRDFLEQNLSELWVPSDFQNRFLEYLDKVEGKVNSLQELAAQMEAAQDTAPPLGAPGLAPAVAKAAEVKPEDVTLAIEVLEDPGMTPEEKSEVLSAIGQDLMRSLNQISERGEEPRRAGIKRCKQLADEILDIAYKNKSIYDEILALRASQDDLEHSMMVGTIAVMFGLAAGISDKDILADLTLAGLFHDIGLTKVNPNILTKPENQWTGPERTEYEAHIAASIALLKESSKDFNPGVFRMIQEHHENYDGSGFPEHRQGGGIAEHSQILHLSNLFDRLCNGKIDGRECSPQGAFDRIGQIATNPSAVQEVDPELVRKIFKFMMKDAGRVLALQKEEQIKTVRNAEDVFSGG